MSEFNEFLNDNGMAAVLEASGEHICPGCGQVMTDSSNKPDLAHFCGYYEAYYYFDYTKSYWHRNEKAPDGSNHIHRIIHCEVDIECKNKAYFDV